VASVDGGRGRDEHHAAAGLLLPRGPPPPPRRGRWVHDVVVADGGRKIVGVVITQVEDAARGDDAAPPCAHSSRADVGDMRVQAAEDELEQLDGDVVHGGRRPRRRQQRLLRAVPRRRLFLHFVFWDLVVLRLA
jgi:hypothetical protein